MGVGLEFAATAEQSIMYGTKTRETTASVSASISVSAGLFSASASIAYYGSGADTVDKGTLTLGAKASTSIFHDSFGISAGYSYSHDYKNDKETRKLSAGLSSLWGQDNNHPGWTIRADAFYSLGEIMEDEKWYNHLSFSVSLNGMVKHANKEVDYNQILPFGWNIKPIYSSGASIGPLDIILLDRDIVQKTNSEIFGKKKNKNNEYRF